MILPDNPGLKIMLFGAIGVLGPIFAIKERNKLPVNTAFGSKWRKIKLFEAIVEIIFGTIGIVVFTFQSLRLQMAETVNDVLFIAAFILMLFIGIVKDTYVKAEKNRSEIE